MVSKKAIGYLVVFTAITFASFWLITGLQPATVGASKQTGNGSTQSRNYLRNYIQTPASLKEPASYEGWEFGDVANFTMEFSYKAEETGLLRLHIRGDAEVVFGSKRTSQYAYLSQGRGSGIIPSNFRNPRWPAVDADYPLGSWNFVRVTLVGEMLTLELNDKVLFEDVKLDSSTNPARPIAPVGPLYFSGNLPTSGVLLAKWSAEQSTDYLKNRNTKDLEPIFNGTSLDGWIGDRESYFIADDSIITKEGGKGSIFFDDFLTNYHARFEFKLPPNGNSGIALRYPGYDPPHLSGLELQVLDSGSDNYVHLDDRQHHGSVYGAAAAYQGYLAPPGQWNYQEIDYNESLITVRLNGFTVLQTDLTKTPSFLNGELPDGLSQTEGMFGILGHSDPVAFRNLAIRKSPLGPPSPWTVEASVTPRETIDLLEGSELSAFYTYLERDGYTDPTELFSLNNNILHVRGDDFGALTTRASYANYKMSLEYKWGKRTWGRRSNSARDTGILVHGYGPDQAFGPWQSSVEAQIIEGGTGDILILNGKDKYSGTNFPVYVEATSTRSFFDPSGTKNMWTQGRVNWWGRSHSWEDKKGFRGSDDLEHPVGEWNSLEIVADGSSIEIYVNGKLANRAISVYPHAGQISLQSELAEFSVRNWILSPLDAPQ